MADHSNPTGRVMDVLNFLAAHPTDAFSLTEIARHIGLTNGSAHRILTTLANGMFLTRNEKHRTYSLGLGLVAIGQASIERHRGIEIARHHIARLGAELGVQCSINTVAHDEIVVLAKEGTAQSQLGLTRVGERRPLVPPVGISHVAWSGEDVIAGYVEKARPLLSKAMLQRLIDTFPLVRNRGFALAAKGPRAGKGHDATWLPMDQVRDAAYWNAVAAMIGELTPGEIQVFDISEAVKSGVSYISVPIFSPERKVAFQLVASGLPRDLTAPDIERNVERLTAAAASITIEIHGRAPEL